MRGRDDDTGDFKGPSRSEQRRAALDVLSLGEKLATLTPVQLAKLPVPESLLPHIADTRRMTAHGARKRQVAFLAKQMRREDDETLDAIRDALDAGGDSARR
ncbi:MAG: ribosome biogenesis factor YjgA, partial [Luteimonas sp.]